LAIKLPATKLVASTMQENHLKEQNKLVKKQGNFLKNLALAAASAAAIAAAALVGQLCSSEKPDLPESFIDSDLVLEGKRLKGWAAGAEGLIADWYWMMSLQYMGDKIVKYKDKDIDLENLSQLNPRLLYQYLNNATELDPHFLAAYSYGAVVLPAIDRQQAIELTEKGIRNNPKEWRLYQYLGYIFWRSGDYKKAAEVYAKGAEIEGAPSFMREMVGAMLTQGGSRETARTVYKQLFETAEDQQGKENARLRLLELDALDELDIINNFFGRQMAEKNDCPKSAVAAAQAFAKSPNSTRREFRVNEKGELVDPSGTPYQFDQQKCQFRISYLSKIPKPTN
jgi:tetratricopeptide (TPR) repeat protein